MFALQFVKWVETVSHPYCYCYCHRVPLCATFFSQKWHPNFWLFWYNIIDALPPLCLRSAFALAPL